MMRALLLKNPIPTRQDFAAGGSRLPILTRNPTQSTAGFQTFGLPGGGINRTSLGAIRMGDDDGNGPASAIVGDPGDIFFPFRAPDRKYPSVMFEQVGNNVYQPDTVQRAAATEALLKSVGDKQFKATEAAPFEDYFATQRLARDVDMASRNAGLEDLGHSREIMRSLVAERRKGDEDDFLRRMLDAGMTQQDAQMEIDNVRRANALQEARKVEDRTHQSKLLIQRIAKSRGILSSVNEPLTTSGAIENPQPNERMADMTGQPENAYGSSPLDRDRIFKTPEFYRKMLRRTALTQEAGDEMSALANAAAQATGPVPTPAMLQGLERQDAIERKRDSVAARLETAGTRRLIVGKMPSILEPFDSILSGIKKAGSSTRFREVETEDLFSFNAILALNQIINQEPAKLVTLKQELSAFPNLREAGITEILRRITVNVVGVPTIALPVVAERPVTPKQILDMLQKIKLLSGDEVKQMRSQTQRLSYSPFLDDQFTGLSANVPLPPPVDTRSLGRVTEDLVRTAIGDAQRELRAEVRAPAVRIGAAITERRKAVSSMNLSELQEEAQRMGMSTEGTKTQLKARINSLR
jgi:hypothetical protein